MRLLVVSDSHGDLNTLNLIIKAQPKAEVIIHCGDGCNDIESIKKDYPEKFILAVKGNCDFNTNNVNNDEIITLENKKIFITHGYNYKVKFGNSLLCKKARDLGTDILIYGHTHNALYEYQNGLYILNPGSIKSIKGTYAIIDITKGGISINIIPTNTLYDLGVKK